MVGQLYLAIVLAGSVAEPPLFWSAPAPDGQGPGADSGSCSDLLGSAPAPAPGKKRQLQAAAAQGKKRWLQATPAPYTKIFHFKLSKS